MKIVVIGGTGLIGSRLVSILRSKGHEVLAASPDSGVNTITGEGLDAALTGAQVVVDVANSPKFDESSIQFFETSGTHLLAAEQRAGVRHHVALSIVGTDRLPGSAYLRAKVAQEKLIRNSGIPYSILRSTQFFEFIGRIAGPVAGSGESVHVSAAKFQPILSADVVATLADVTLGAPLNGIVEVGGPEKFSMAELVERVLRANGDQREVIADAHVPYFGAEIDDDSLVTGPGARLGSKHFEEWLKESASQPHR
jgi:uncharacterized protein YbjT (DUF2867 family)